AKMMRKQGVVSVSFSVGADGSLSGERVTTSSGDESLDNAALEAVRSARPVGPKPAGFASSVSVPISFTIQ
ncbi:MAG: energy transducer TonB, partial [Haemophilus parainfluenzae]|nr:energy transducer TonB [Haemophilus parainfluenzae]